MTAAKDNDNAKITCAGNGPYIVSGLAHLTGVDGAAIPGRLGLLLHQVSCLGRAQCERVGHALNQPLEL